MRFLKKNWILISIFAASTIAGLFYFHYRGSVFRTPPEHTWLTQPFSKQEISDLIVPFASISPDELRYTIDTYVDRNAVKYVEKTANDETFEKLLTHENIPLWGWIIKIEKPAGITLRVSHLRELTGIQFNQSTYAKVFTPTELNASIEKKLDKNLKSYKVEALTSPPDIQRFKFERKIGNTELLERIILVLDHGRFKSVESFLYLPQTYANIANESIEKQKTLHLFFNLFHYFLIGLVFLTLFHVYESRTLYWRRALSIFIVYFLFQYTAYFFQSNFDQRLGYTLFQTLLKTLSETLWIYILIVISDFVSRTTQRMPHSLLDLTRKSFLVSEEFRSSVVIGWTMAIIQVIFVWNFYKISSLFSSYIPLKIPGEHSQHHILQFMQYLSDSVSTSMREEILYRLFFIGLFVSIFKRATLAVIFSSILWGFLHFSYQFEPYYVRGIELTLIGFFYGWMMVRCGIVSVLVAHFVYNSFILSEYEFQFSGYLLGINISLAIACLISYLYRNSTQPFEVEHDSFPPISKRMDTYTERRSIYERLYPVSSKYIWISVIVLLAVVFWFPVRHHFNPTTQNSRLTHMSSELVSNYVDISSTWNVSYYRENPSILKIKEEADQFAPTDRNKVLNELRNQETMVTIRYLSRADNHVICDFDFSSNEELLRLNCPNFNTQQPLLFDTQEWIDSLKEKNESWRLTAQKSTASDRMVYMYDISKPSVSTIGTVGTLVKENEHIIQFKKDFFLRSDIPVTEKSEWQSNIVPLLGLTLVGAIIFICFVLLFIATAKTHKLYERKSAMGALVTAVMYVLWNINSYKKFLIGFDSSMTLQHFVTNKILYQMGLVMCATFGTYVLMYAFFHFPTLVYKHAPTSSQWAKILTRPIWRWRNAKTSLLYSVLLICIQTFLNIFIQITNHASDLDLFDFDISYLNHDYLIITFIGIVWKYVLFWMLILVIMSSLERYIRRWVYLSILAGAILMNAILFEGAIVPKLIELSSIFIVFYFIYRVVRFDFAFYGWFIVLNALFTFLPILFHSEFRAYSQQIYALVIGIVSIAAFTLYRNNKPAVEVATPAS